MGVQSVDRCYEFLVLCRDLIEQFGLRRTATSRTMFCKSSVCRYDRLSISHIPFFRFLPYSAIGVAHGVSTSIGKSASVLPALSPEALNSATQEA